MILTIIPSVISIEIFLNARDSAILIAIFALALLVAREMLSTISNPRARVLCQLLTIAIVPLLIGFVIAAIFSVTMLLT